MKYSFTGCLIGPSMGCVCDGIVNLKILDTVLPGKGLVEIETITLV